MRRSGRKKSIVPLVAVIAACAAVAVFLAVFYVPDSNAEVLGSTRYKDGEIRQIVMPGFFDHNSVFLQLFRNSVATDDIPFINSIDVEYISRDSVRLHVNEDYPVGYILRGDQKFYFDSVGLVTESISAAGEDAPKDTAAAEDADEEKDGNALKAEAVTSSNTLFRPAVSDVAEVTGLTEDELEVGNMIVAEDPEVFPMLLALSKLLNKFEMLPDEVRVEEGTELSLIYGRVRIALGGNTMLEEKVSRAAAILPQLAGLSGTLHLERYSEETMNIIFEETDPDTGEPLSEAENSEVRLLNEAGTMVDLIDVTVH